MVDGTDVVCGTMTAFKCKEQHSEQHSERLKDGIEKFRMALNGDAKASARRKSGLPKDWRSRVLK